MEGTAVVGVAAEAATTVGSPGILPGTALPVLVDTIVRGCGLAFVFCGSFVFFFLNLNITL